MEATNGTVQRSLHWHMVRGTALGMLLRWSDRIAGLVGTVILARLLTPEDYGIVAIATLIVQAVEVFSQTGQHMLLIRHPNPTREHYDTAWTIGLILGLLLATIIVALTPLTVIYFQEPRAQLVVAILALRVALFGFQNVGTVDFRRNLDFQKQFRFQLIPALVGLVIQITAAFVFRNYWALVVGIMSQSVCAFLLSYVMSPYRPRLSLAKAREIYGFSTWILLKNVGNLVGAEVDKFVIGGFAGAAAMGRYNVAREIATIPGQEMTGPMLGVLLPVMASARDDREQQRQLYLTALYWSGVIFAVAGIGVALVAKDMTDLLLGPNWHDVKPLIPWFSVTFGIVALSSSVFSAFDTLGRADISAKLQWFRVIWYAIAVCAAAYLYRDLMTVIIARFAVTVLLTPALFYALGEALDMPASRFWSTLWRPLAAGSVMALAVILLNAALGFSGPVRLALDMGGGAMAFGGSLMLFWFVTGCPEGPERALWFKIRMYIGARRPQPTAYN